jgi:hypothetical protein
MVGSLACWLVMFLAASDVWHDTGRADFWRLQGPPYNDLRVFAIAFYLLLALLCVSIVLLLYRMLRNARQPG